MKSRSFHITCNGMPVCEMGMALDTSGAFCGHASLDGARHSVARILANNPDRHPEEIDIVAGVCPSLRMTLGGDQ